MLCYIRTRLSASQILYTHNLVFVNFMNIKQKNRDPYVGFVNFNTSTISMILIRIIFCIMNVFPLQFEGYIFGPSIFDKLYYCLYDFLPKYLGEPTNVKREL